MRFMSPKRRLLVLRCVAWFCIILIAYLSLVPRSLEVRTPAPAGIEHAVAYGGTAVLMALAYPARSAWAILGSLAAYSGLMELLQDFSPGRHPGLDGVLWSSAGAAIGTITVALHQAKWRSRSGLRAQQRGKGWPSANPRRAGGEDW
jgi:VanZ family protein